MWTPGSFDQTAEKRNEEESRVPEKVDEERLKLVVFRLCLYHFVAVGHMN